MYGVKINGKMLEYYYRSTNEFEFTDDITEAQCYLSVDSLLEDIRLILEKNDKIDGEYIEIEIFIIVC